jgi:hypothetical protein
MTDSMIRAQVLCTNGDTFTVHAVNRGETPEDMEFKRESPEDLVCEVWDAVTEGCAFWGGFGEAADVWVRFNQRHVARVSCVAFDD